MRMDAPVEHPYGSDETGSKYQGQGEPTPSRFYLNFEQLSGPRLRRAGEPAQHPQLSCRTAHR